MAHWGAFGEMMKKTIFLMVIIYCILLTSCPKKNENQQVEQTVTDKVVENKEVIEKSFITEHEQEESIPLPDEFTSKEKWSYHSGTFSKEQEFNIETLRGCTWSYGNVMGSFLNFSDSGNYCYAGYWSGPISWGKYTVEGTKINFTPPLMVSRYEQKYYIDTLEFTKINHMYGPISLIDNEDSVVFHPYESEELKENETFFLNGIECKKVHKEITIKNKGTLYAKPDTSSYNLFEKRNYILDSDIYRAYTICKPINESEWYYCGIDFTDPMDASDGGGPYYYGWLPSSSFEEWIPCNVQLLQDVTTTDNLNLRTKPGKEGSIIKLIPKGSKARIGQIGPRETIDGIQSDWVYVFSVNNSELSDGNDFFSGWCFGGYLE